MSLNSIPQETIQNVAAYLEDKDLVNFRTTCLAVKAAIDARPAHFWMYRYKEHFDIPRKPYTLDNLRDKYQARRKALRSIPMFKHGVTAEENLCLKHLLDLILDADPISMNECGVPYSKNFEVMDHVIKTTNILQCIFVHDPKIINGNPMHQGKKVNSQKDLTPKGTVLQMFQLLLSARSLNFTIPNPSIFSFPESQQMVYMDAVRQPIFGGASGMEVNLVWALHVVNFFRYHMLQDIEFTLCPAFRDLNEINEGLEMPQMWKKKLSNNGGPVPVGRYWKGSYAYLGRREIASIRKDRNIGCTVYEDHNVDLGHKAIQEMVIDFPNEAEKGLVWPKLFEDHLSGQNFLVNKTATVTKRTSRKTRSGSCFVGSERPEDLETRYFDAVGWDDENFNGSGYITQLPSQMNVPGFKRIVMMKYFINGDNTIDLKALWAYEGIVLPGDQIIVGRWWSPEASQNLGKIYSGPFIWWNTDCGSKYHKVQENNAQDETLTDIINLTHG